MEKFSPDFPSLAAQSEKENKRVVWSKFIVEISNEYKRIN